MMKKNSQAGFTLIEIMIAIAIMAALTVYTAQSIQAALSISSKYGKRIEESSELRDVLGIMERDISLAFHYRDIYSTMNAELKKEKNKGQEQNDEEEKPSKNYTVFQGEKNQLHFSSLSHVRTGLDSKKSNQAEISYYVKPCEKKRTKKKQSVQCLWRRISNHIDKKIHEGGRAIALLEDVKSLSFRYVGENVEDGIAAEKEIDWKEKWLSGEGGEEKTRDKFPVAVEISISVNRIVDGKPVAQSMQSIARVRFPNNAKKKPATDESETEDSDDENEDNQ